LDERGKARSTIRQRPKVLPMSILQLRVSILLIALAASCLIGCSGCQKETADKVDHSAEVNSASSGDPDSDSQASQTANEVQSEPTGDEANPAENATDQPAQTASAMIPVPDPASEKIGTKAAGTPLTAEETRKQAAELYKRAQSQSDKPGRAFQDASRAWELLSQYPDDAESQAMAAEIADQLEGMAVKANAPYRGQLSDDRMLIEK